MLLFGVFSLVAFAVWEDYYPFPLLNPVVWKNRTYTLCILCVFFGYMSFITNLFWISLYMQEVQHLSGLQIAVRLLPQALVGFIWSYVGQALVSKIPGKLIMGIGGFAYLVGATLQFFVRQDTSYWLLLFPALCITVIGADFQFIVSNVRLPSTLFHHGLTALALHLQANADSIFSRCWRSSNSNARLHLHRPCHLVRSLWECRTNSNGKCKRRLAIRACLSLLNPIRSH
jgi:hypothetical protein